MRIRFVSNVLAAVGFLAVAGAADAQSGTITGKVTQSETTRPVSGAQVSVLSGATRVGTGQTSDDGTYRIGNVPVGTYTLLVARIGFSARRTDGVQVTAGGTTTTNVALAEVAAQLNQVVTTATRGAEPEKILDSPNSISVVTAERIAERPSVTVTDLIKTQPGLSISNGGIAQANIVSRGFNNAFSTTMLMLQDYRFAGVPSLRVNVPILFTGVNEDIDRIEILQGPASALYGPNSGSGVLHVITKSPFQSQGTTLTLDGGERSLMRLGVRHAGSFGEDKFGYKVSGEYFTASDWEYNDPNETAASPTYAAADTLIPVSRRGQPIQRDFSLERYSAEARLDYRPNEDTEFITTVGRTMLGNAIEITTVFGAAQARNWSYTNVQQRYRRKKFFAQIFYNTSDAGNDHALDDAGTYYLRSGRSVVDQSSVLVGQVQQGFNFAGTKFTTGLDYIATTPKTAGTIMGRNEDDDNIAEVGGYLQFTRPVTGKLDFMGAVRADNNSRIEGVQFSPRAAFLYKATPTQNFRFTFNRAFNSPASFSFFLDQYSGRTPAPGMPVQAMGNAPKIGWNFSRTCNAAINGGLCMRSPYGAGEIASAAAPVWPTFTASLSAIVTGLPVSAFGPGGEAARTALLGVLAGPVGNIVRGLTPTTAQAPSVMVNLNTNTPIFTAASVTDLAPLGANFSNTWELGYKGIFGSKLRVALDYWYQIRPAEPTTQIINPGVLYIGAFLAPYLTAQITAGLQAPPYNLSPAAAAGNAAAVVPGLVGVMAAIPQGALAFNNPNHTQPYLVFSYQNAVGTMDARGVDLGLDYLLNDAFTLEATWSYLARTVYPRAPGATALNPLAANAPKNRVTTTVRWANAMRSVTSEFRVRYYSKMEVNSGVYNTFNLNTPVPYEQVPENLFVDGGFSWRLPFSQNVRWAVNGQNLLGNEVNSFIGVPKIGRMITTRLQYSF